MKLMYICLLKVLITIACGLQLEPYTEINCPSLIEFRDKKLTLFLDLVENSNEDIKTCVLKNVTSEQSMLSIHGYNTKKKRNLSRYRTTNNPNVIIMTKDITPFTLLLTSIKIVLTSYHSSLLILITSETRFKCKAGAMDIDDFLSLKIFMNELWHKYKIMRVVVSFPLSCKQKLAIYNGTIITSHTLYDRTIQLIDINKTNILHDIIEQSGKSLTENYPMKAHIFFRYPTSITNCKNLHYYANVNLNLTNGFCGFDGLIMHDIAKHFKFKFYFLNNDNCYKYGYASPNNITGSLGCIIRKELDVSFNSRFIRMYSSHYISFMPFVGTDSLCALVKTPDIIPLWHHVINLYEHKLWLLIILLLITIGIIIWIMAIFNHKITGDKREPLYFYIGNAFILTMLGFSLKMKGRWYSFRSICLCSSIMFMAIYQGYINHVFTTLQRHKIISTLDALYNSDKVLYLSPSTADIITDAYNEEEQELGEYLKRAHLIEENYFLDVVIQNPNLALVGRKNDVVIEIQSNYSDKDGKPKISIIKECFGTYYLSYIAQTGFPFFEELQNFLVRLVEAGLPSIYYRWTCNMLRVSRFLPKYHMEHRPFSKINLDDYRIPFGLLCFGYLGSIIAFFIELWRGKHNVCPSR